MTWDNGQSYLEEMAPGVYAFVQPDGGWMVNNCGVVVDASGDAVLIDTTSTERRNRSFLAEVAGVTDRDPRIAEGVVLIDEVRRFDRTFAWTYARRAD
jgi:cyclase